MDKKSENPELISWQRRLLPLMIKVVLILAIFFFLASLAQLAYLHNNIKNSPEISENWIAELEHYVIQKRYHQGHTSLMSRIWIKYLGFVTGMILSIIGATFVLGKLQESESKIELTSSQVRLSIISSSPGIILAILGTVIMITTIVTKQPIELYDDSVYFRSPNSRIIYVDTTVTSIDSIGDAQLKEGAKKRPKPTGK
jgi:hypothetical protein